MKPKQYEATLLTEEAENELTEELAETFEDLHVKIGPGIDDIVGVVGTVDSCELRDGEIVCELSMYDEDTCELIERGEATACPTIIERLSDDGFVKGSSVFMSDFPASYVGETVPM